MKNVCVNEKEYFVVPLRIFFLSFIGLQCVFELIMKDKQSFEIKCKHFHKAFRIPQANANTLFKKHKCEFVKFCNKFCVFMTRK